MGNCLKINNTDNISLLRGNERNNAPDFSTEQPNAAPIYSVTVLNLYIKLGHNIICKSVRTKNKTIMLKST